MCKSVSGELKWWECFNLLTGLHSFIKICGEYGSFLLFLRTAMLFNVIDIKKSIYHQ